ncbi:hypothetical protein BC833DRAFT_589766 [Globomyces pollinis-pini]|nr:hypothetical protein BC833DRAFT_589766 [Globomyces pollinis-pini]
MATINSSQTLNYTTQPTDEYISAFDSDHTVQNLKRFNLIDVGSIKWLKQHQSLEQLNIQAHKNIAKQQEEYVTESFLTFEKVEFLIYDLILVQTWKSQIYPQLKHDLISKNSTTTYFILYHEATLINLLQIIMMEPRSCQQCPDALLDLVDIIDQKLHSLIHWTHTHSDPLTIDDETRFNESIQEMEFIIALNTLSILRSISDTITTLSITLINKILIDKDLVSVLVLVLESSPWIRNLTTLQRFENMQWVNITPEDMLVVSHPEGQVWLSLMNLLLEPNCRKTYLYSKKNQTIVLRLKDYMGEETVDQLPPLVDLQRYLEELGLLEVPDTINPSIGIQPVSTLHTQIAAQYTPTMVETHRELLVNMSTCDRKSMADSLAQMYDLTDMMDLLSDPKCGACGIMATQRCSLCKSEWYCGRACQVKNWKSHKSICELLRK